MGKHDSPAKPLILVADDSRDTADVYGFLLEKAGYRVATAYDGLTALALAKVNRPDVAILNYLMPGMSGLDILRELRAADALTTVIITSGTNDFGPLAERAHAAGAKICVRLPCPADRLLRMVSAALAQPRGFRERP